MKRFLSGALSERSTLALIEVGVSSLPMRMFVDRTQLHLNRVLIKVFQSICWRDELYTGCQTDKSNFTFNQVQMWYKPHKLRGVKTPELNRHIDTSARNDASFRFCITY